MTPPIRFLATAMGSWACLRGAMLVPWQEELPPGAAPVRLPAASTGPAAAPDTRGAHLAEAAFDGPRRPPDPPADPGSSRGKSRGGGTALPAPPLPQSPESRLYADRLGWTLPGALPEGRQPPRARPARSRVRQAARQPVPSRWTASAWFHGRSGDAPALAPGGLLGGSQAGARLGYRPTPAVLFVGRVSAPLRRVSGAEAAVGVEWQPSRSLPLRLLAERRQALGPEGRSAFAVTLHGGVGEVPLPAGFRLDAYGQAGAVGLRSRDLFAEGSVRAAKPIAAGLSLGAGVWAAAQPGASRLDIGPSVTLRLPQLGATVSADWRFRTAGRARPGSGPALTLWKDF